MATENSFYFTRSGDRCCDPDQSLLEDAKWVGLFILINVKFAGLQFSSNGPHITELLLKIYTLTWVPIILLAWISDNHRFTRIGGILEDCEQSDEVYVVIRA